MGRVRSEIRETKYQVEAISSKVSSFHAMSILNRPRKYSAKLDFLSTTVMNWEYERVCWRCQMTNSVCNWPYWLCLCFLLINSDQFQASSLTVLSDIEKREKKEVMGKLHEMEKELKVGQTETSSEERMLGVILWYWPLLWDLMWGYYLIPPRHDGIRKTSQTHNKFWW